MTVLGLSDRVGMEPGIELLLQEGGWGFCVALCQVANKVTLPYQAALGRSWLAAQSKPLFALQVHA